MNNIPSAGEREYQEANGQGREIAASVTDKSVAELVSLTAPWGWGKREQVHQSVRQGCCLHTQTHSHTLKQRDPSARVHQKKFREKTDFKKKSCVSPLQKNLPRVLIQREDGEAVRERQGADTRQLGEPGQEQSSSWCRHVFQLWREIEAAHFQHARTGSLTCCLATDCNNPQFTLRQLPLKHRLSGENCRCMIYRWIVCLCGRFASHAVCIHLQNSVVFVCGRLFELDPELLTLFHYTTNCGSTQDCLSSPEFLEHVTKVMLVIDAAVSHLDDLPSLEDFLLNLGRKHQAVGVNTQSFAEVGESLLYMLQCSLGQAYTALLRQAWLNLYSIVVAAMSQGWAKNGEDKAD